MDFIKNMYEEGLVEKQLPEDAWADIRARRLERATADRNIALYGYLVGIENAMKAKRVAELANDGKAIPANFIEAYLPIIDMIDDFIAAGPAGVARLKQAHKSVKKGR
jgi:hypothetical protein